MKQIGPLFSHAATTRPRRARGEGADRHSTDAATAAGKGQAHDGQSEVSGGGVSSAPWPVEMTEIGWQYVIPGCERRDPTPARPAPDAKEVGHD